MAVLFSRSDVDKVARLAHLELTEAELDLFARQLGDILEYANHVQRIDTTGVPPTTSVLEQEDADRPDEIAPGLERGTALANAPDANRETGLFRVPRVIS